MARPLPTSPCAATNTVAGSRSAWWTYDGRGLDVIARGDEHCCGSPLGECKHMDRTQFTQIDEYAWRIAPFGDMRVPAILYASGTLFVVLVFFVFEHVTNVAALLGFGFAAFDADEDGVISAGGVGFDISCGVRSLVTGLTRNDVLSLQKQLADLLYYAIPAGLGSTGAIRLSSNEMDAMLSGGARWAVDHGYGSKADLSRVEVQGCMRGADAAAVSEHAKRRQRDEMGTLGSGNHYLEVQQVTAIYV